MTRLPFKGDTSTFGNSQKNALRRFLSMERRLDSNIELKLEYVKFMQDYENLGHMSMVKDLDLNSPHYFIPHHYVIKPDSTTTKLRVVGPTIQNELVITLLRFRLYQYGITADITIMYRQFWLHRSDRNFQLILWREHKSQNISVYQLNTVTYGTSSAQFLATRCLHYIADNYPYRKETGKMILKRDFYVDDMISGADDLETLQAIKNETTEILDFYNLSLTKWNSNNVNITAPNVKLTDIETARDMACPLGMLWNTKEDYFCFTFQSTNIPASHTKRNILSLASSLYDPLGLITPLIIKAKILLQQLWIIGCDWDESVPQEIYTTWNKILADLHQVVCRHLICWHTDFERSGTVKLAGKSQPAIVRELKANKISNRIVYRTLNRYDNTDSVAKHYGSGQEKTGRSPKMIQKVKTRLERNPRRSGN
ncbi:uncharacterized protein LOC119667414 [Teleopsis dalmanni]|uniref:uncharacterized protein LOC119667414 n=1 Tax=Teleopsis dalmanni TaxID=139649 RepID=UPI0018CFA38F|nr:uncharacterized protein LOC119667414 [Teleopsis dalmanni]